MYFAQRGTGSLYLVFEGEGSVLPEGIGLEGVVTPVNGKIAFVLEHINGTVYLSQKSLLGKEISYTERT